MPTYLFTCENCGDIELTLPADEPKPVVCDCGGGLRRRWQATPSHLHGGGFHVADYGFKKPITEEDAFR